MIKICLLGEKDSYENPRRKGKNSGKRIVRNNYSNKLEMYQKKTKRIFLERMVHKPGGIEKDCRKNDTFTI